MSIMSKMLVKTGKKVAVGAVKDFAGTTQYLGLSIEDLTADLIGLEAVLDFHAWDVDLEVNAVVVVLSDKLDWDSLTITEGLDLSANPVLANVDTTNTGAAVVTKDITEPGVYSSAFAAEPDREWKRKVARFRRLDRLSERVTALEKK